MENSFERVRIDSTMLKASFLSGHTREVARPCIVYAVYSAKTGTLGLDYVWCDGDIYTVRDVSSDDKQKYYDELREHIVEQYS